MKNLKTLFFALTWVLLVFGSGNAWGDTDPVELYRESFYSTTTKAAAATADKVTATKRMFYDTTATVWSHYTSCSSISKNQTGTHSQSYCSGNTQTSIQHTASAASTEYTILEVTDINIQGASALKLNYAFKFSGGTNYKSYAKIDNGSYTQISTATSGSTWQYVTSQNITGTGNKLSLKFTYTSKSANNIFYLDEILVTGTASTKTAGSLNKGEHGAANGSVTYTVGSSEAESPSWVSASGSYNLTGYFDSNNVKVIDANNALVSGTDYVGSDGKWKYSSTELTLTAKWESAGPSCTASPSVSAGSISDATASSLTFNCFGGISKLGSDGCSITEYGYVWGTSSEPTTSDNKHSMETTYTTTGTSFGAYTPENLSCGTTYYMRPYAINGNGTAYGTQASLSTSACPVDHFIDDVQGTTGYTGDGKAVSAAFTKASVTLADKEPATTGSCEQVHYHFVGWVTADDKASGNVDDSHIVNFQAEGNVPTNTTYYAVWAKEKTE